MPGAMQATSPRSVPAASAAVPPRVLVPVYESEPPAAANPPPDTAFADALQARQELQEAELGVNSPAFGKIKPELLRTRPGQFALMKGGEVVGFFRDREDAFRSAEERFGRDGVYSVMEISDRPLTRQEWKAAMRQWVREKYGGSLPVARPPTYIQNGVVVGSIERPYVASGPSPAWPED